MRRWILLFVTGLIGLPLLLRLIELDDSFVVFVFGCFVVFVFFNFVY